VAATRPQAVNGLGLKTSEAITNVNWFERRLVFFEEIQETTRFLVELVANRGLCGKRIHDANIAAVARTHGIHRLVTSNVADFEDLVDLPVHRPSEFLAMLKG
jgi:predicted nucleic acid-binding protein